MDNKIEGSESHQVQNCHIAYAGGWKDSDKKISTCSYNSANFIANYNLFGLQEVNKKMKDEFIRTIRNNNPSANFQFIGSSYGQNVEVMVGYDENITGHGILVTPPGCLIPLSKECKDRRGIQVIWFEKLRLLFVNLHLPHDINVKEVIEEFGRDLSKKIKYNAKRILMVGDFNDANGSLIGKNVQFLGMMLRVDKNIKSCCTDASYKYPGDYILDTKTNAGYYGFPKEYDRYDPIMSDHDPIVLIDE